jgi:hypothetical protein
VAQTLTAGQASQAMQISLPTAPSSNVAASLVSSSGNGTFSTSASGPGSTTLPLMIQAGQTNSPTFYYQDTRAGTPTLTASASGYTSGTQTETVQPSTLATLTVSPSSATLTVGGSQPFSATGADEYGNSVNLSSASWTTTAPGTLSPGSGPTTTFTASSQTGSGLVTATAGSVHNSATVTVTALTALTAPSNLTASTQGKRISLSWTGSGPGVTYNLYRATAPGQEQPYASGLTSTSAIDTNALAGTTYYYYVTAVSPAGTESTPTNEASAKAK